MNISKSSKDALATVLTDTEGQEFLSVVDEEAVQGWSVFRPGGAVVASEGVSDTVMTACTNILEIAQRVGEELGESDPRPALTFSKRGQELFTLPLTETNILVVKDQSSGFRREFRNGR